jgi:hypothetical protein
MGLGKLGTNHGLAGWWIVVVVGLSLRRKSKLIETIQKCKLEIPQEDMWYAECFLQLPKSGNYSMKLAPQETAKNFSAESIYSANPMGVHKPWFWLNREDVPRHFHVCRVCCGFIRPVV